MKKTDKLWNAEVYKKSKQFTRYKRESKTISQVFILNVSIFHQVVRWQNIFTQNGVGGLFWVRILRVRRLNEKWALRMYWNLYKHIETRCFLSWIDFNKLVRVWDPLTSVCSGARYRSLGAAGTLVKTPLLLRPREFFTFPNGTASILPVKTSAEVINEFKRGVLIKYDVVQQTQVCGSVNNIGGSLWFCKISL